MSDGKEAAPGASEAVQSDVKVDEKKVEAVSEKKSEVTSKPVLVTGACNSTAARLSNCRF